MPMFARQIRALSVCLVIASASLLPREHITSAIAHDGAFRISSYDTPIRLDDIAVIAAAAPRSERRDRDTDVGTPDRGPRIERREIAAADNAGWEPMLAYPGSLQTINTMAAAGRYVYIAFGFGSHIGKETLDGRIARWDGERWISLGDKVSGGVAALTAVGDDLYVAGSFESIGGKNIAGVAKWSGATNTWSAVGSGVGPRENSGGISSPTANDIAVVGNTVYIAGEFTSVDGVEMYHVAKFNGTTWSPIGNGVYNDPTGQNGEVLALDATQDGRVMIAGKFTHFFTNPTGNAITPAKNIALYDPTQGKLTDIGGASAVPNDIHAAEADFYVAGGFATAGTTTVNGIARYTNGGWQALGVGLGNGVINQVVFRHGVLFAGGSFGTIGGVGSHRVAVWNGSAWQGIDSTNTNEDSVFAVAATSDGYFYAAGDFDELGGLRGNNIARWSLPERRWRTVGEGLGDSSLSADVSAMYALPDGTVIVAGDIPHAGGVAVNNLGLWNPRTKRWSAWEGGVDGSVSAITRIGGQLYFGGAFTRIGGINAANIATFDLTTREWRAIGALDGAVFAIAPAHDGLVYIGGNFTATPAGAVDRMALYNPANGQWNVPPVGIDTPGPFYRPSVFAFLPDADGVLFTGRFFSLRINGQETQERFNSIAYWNRKTGTISRFGTGATSPNATLGSIAAVVSASTGDLYLGGEFTAFDGVAANNIVRLRGQARLALGTGLTSPSPASPQVLDMLQVGNCIFIGGDFVRAGTTQSARAVVFHVGRDAWEALGDGIGGGDIDSEVRSIVAANGQVYFGGEFWYAGDGQSGSFAAFNLQPTTPVGPPTPTDPSLTFKLRLPVIGKAGQGGLGICA